MSHERKSRNPHSRTKANVANAQAYLFPKNSADSASQFNSTGTEIRNACIAMSKAAAAINYTNMNLNPNLSSLEQTLFNQNNCY